MVPLFADCRQVEGRYPQSQRSQTHTVAQPKYPSHHRSPRRQEAPVYRCRMSGKSPQISLLMLGTGVNATFGLVIELKSCWDSAGFCFIVSEAFRIAARPELFTRSEQ